MAYDDHQLEQYAAHRALAGLSDRPLPDLYAPWRRLRDQCRSAERGDDGSGLDLLRVPF